jgi:hypothetical protein
LQWFGKGGRVALKRCIDVKVAGYGAPDRNAFLEEGLVRIFYFRRVDLLAINGRHGDFEEVLFSIIQ